MELPTRLTTGEAAIYAGKNYYTILHWVKAGFLPASKRLVGHGHEISAKDIDECLRQIATGTTPPRTPKRPHTEARRAKWKAWAKEQPEEWRDKRLAAMRQYYRNRKRRQGA